MIPLIAVFLLLAFFGVALIVYIFVTTSGAKSQDLAGALATGLFWGAGLSALTGHGTGWLVAGIVFSVVALLLTLMQVGFSVE